MLALKLMLEEVFKVCVVWVALVEVEDPVVPAVLVSQSVSKCDFYISKHFSES